MAFCLHKKTIFNEGLLGNGGDWDEHCLKIEMMEV